MKSTENSHKGEKKYFTLAALFPAVVGQQLGTEFATKAEKHFSFIYQTINNTKTTESQRRELSLNYLSVAGGCCVSEYHKNMQRA